MPYYDNAIVESRVLFLQRMRQLIAAITTEQLGFFLHYYLQHQIKRQATLAGLAQQLSHGKSAATFADLVDQLALQAQTLRQQADATKADAVAWAAWWQQYAQQSLPAMAVLPADDAATSDQEQMQAAPFLLLADIAETERMMAMHSMTLCQLLSAKLGVEALKPLKMLPRLLASAPSQDIPANFLDQHPATAALMVEQGRRALQREADGINECFQLAQKAVEEMTACALT